MTDLQYIYRILASLFISTCITIHNPQFLLTESSAHERRARCKATTYRYQYLTKQGGTVAQPVAPTTFGLDAHGGHRFDSALMSFLLSTPRLFSLSFPVPLFTNLSIKGIKSP